MLPLHPAKVLVTGASGTLGYNIVHLLAATHPRTRIVLLMRTPDPALFSACPNVEIRQVDMFDKAKLKQSVLDVQPGAIIHCAASGVRPSNIGWFDLIDLNVESTNQLFHASCQLEDCHFIHISTGLVYRAQPRPCHEDDPIDTLHPYGASKAAADCLLRAGADRLNRHLTVVRPFSFTGLHDGGDRLFPSLLRAARNRTPLKMSQGTQLRDFCAVQDVAEFIRLLLDQSPPGLDRHDRRDAPRRSVFNLGSGQSLPLRSIVEDVRQQLDLDVEIQLGELPFHPHEPLHLVANIDRAQEFGWQPRTNLAYAVWQLAQSQYPDLAVREPKQFS
jgi:nucleoside-diphosphate-sugar epimerase